MLGLNLGLVPVMCDVELIPELNVEEVRNLLCRWMDSNVAEIGHVRDVSCVVNGWENPIFQKNLSGGWINSPDERVLNLVGVIPVVAFADGETLDLIVCRLRPRGMPWQIRFWWDSKQQPADAVRSTTNLQQVVDAFGRMDYQLLDS
jgi:hypothetical protein